MTDQISKEQEKSQANYRHNVLDPNYDLETPIIDSLYFPKDLFDIPVHLFLHLSASQ